MINRIKSIKVLILFFVCLLFITSNLSAYADMMFENNMDDFYNANLDKCENVNEIYTANGTKGYIIGWKSPNSNIKAAEFTNGTKFTIESTYIDKDGVKWGLTYDYDYRGTTKNVIFWVKMSDLKEGDTINVITSAEPPYLWFGIENNAIFILIVLVIVVTIILIRLFWRKNKTNNIKTDMKS